MLTLWKPVWRVNVGRPFNYGFIASSSVKRTHDNGGFVMNAIQLILSTYRGYRLAPRNRWCFLAHAFDLIANVDRLANVSLCDKISLLAFATGDGSPVSFCTAPHSMYPRGVDRFASFSDVLSACTHEIGLSVGETTRDRCNRTVGALKFISDAPHNRHRHERLRLRWTVGARTEQTMHPTFRMWSMWRATLSLTCGVWCRVSCATCDVQCDVCHNASDNDVTTSSDRLVLLADCCQEHCTLRCSAAFSVDYNATGLNYVDDGTY